MNKNKLLGIVGENCVAEYLKNNGFKILVQNYRTRFGEIDLIAQKDEYLIFVEVKTRRVSYFPISTVVNQSKQKKIIKTAKHFLLKNGINERVCRFDVATVIYGSNKQCVDYIENAFYGS